MISTMIFTWLASSLAKDIPNNILGKVTMYIILLLGLKSIFKSSSGKIDNNASKRSKKTNFSIPETTFKLKERTEGGTLYVSEIFEKNGKVTFGCVEPIIYKKIK